MAVAPKTITQPAHEVHEFSSTRKWIIAFSVLLGTVLEGLDSSIVTVSLPHMHGSFSASVDESASLVTSYLVAAGRMLPVSGFALLCSARQHSVATSITAL